MKIEKPKQQDVAAKDPKKQQPVSGSVNRKKHWISKDEFLVLKKYNWI